MVNNHKLYSNLILTVPFTVSLYFIIVNLKEEAMITDVEKWYEQRIPDYREVMTPLKLRNPEIFKNIIPCLPHIDPAYLEPGVIRVLHIGLNSYLSKREYPAEFVHYEFMEHEDWWKEHINEKIWMQHHHMNEVQAQVLHHFPTAAEYRTNLIKIYMGQAIGNKDHIISGHVKDLSRRLTEEELQMLESRNLFPHLIFCYKPLAWDAIRGYFQLFHPYQTREIEKGQILLTGTLENKTVVIQLHREHSIFGFSDHTNIGQVLSHHMHDIEEHLGITI